MSIKLVGEAELVAALRKYAQDAKEEIEKAIRATALNVEGDAVKSMQRGAKSGRKYRLYQPNRNHQASAPGEAPSTDTGQLVGSIRTVDKAVASYVGSDLDYAEYLEFGTMDMQERPWLRPAVEKNRPFFSKRLAAALNDARKKVKK